MKKFSFLAGMLTTALIGGLGFSALAATGQLTITVDPVNIQVNGATFAPKDAKGNDVPVFALNGTTYAPLRALAEAYGLTVGYDGTANMATVAAAPTTPETPKATYSDWSKEDEAAYQEFRGLWVLEYIRPFDTPSLEMRDMYNAYPSRLDNDAIKKYKATPQAQLDLFTERLLLEKKENVGLIVWFTSRDGSWSGHSASLLNDGRFWPGH